jgi:hypothetical protein
MILPPGNVGRSYLRGPAAGRGEGFFFGPRLKLEAAKGGIILGCVDEVSSGDEWLASVLSFGTNAREAVDCVVKVPDIIVRAEV